MSHSADDVVDSISPSRHLLSVFIVVFSGHLYCLFVMFFCLIPRWSANMAVRDMNKTTSAVE